MWTGVAGVSIDEEDELDQRSTKDGGEPANDRVTIPNLYATLMETVLDTGAVRAMAGIPKDVTDVINGASPIRQLM